MSTCGGTGQRVHLHDSARYAHIVMHWQYLNIPNSDNYRNTADLISIQECSGVRQETDSSRNTMDLVQQCSGEVDTSTIKVSWNANSRSVSRVLQYSVP